MSAAELGPDKAHFYLNPTFFIIRGIIYFAGWGFLSWRLLRWSHVEEAGRSTPADFVGIQNLSGAGIVFYGLTITFASVDWVMSLAPEWWSTVFGMLFMVGECLTAFAFTIWLFAGLSPLPWRSPRPGLLAWASRPAPSQPARCGTRSRSHLAGAWILCVASERIYSVSDLPADYHESNWTSAG